jgi:ribosome-binding factor A
MSIRTEKIASVMKRVLAQPINDMAHEYNAGLVTVTTIRVSADLQLAKVYISVYGAKITPLKFINILDEKRGHLRSIVGSAIKTRFTPDLKFFLDDTLDEIDRIQSLLDSIKKEEE